VREKIAGGDWSEDTQKSVKGAVETFAEDFGYDLDEEGLALDDDAPLAKSDSAAKSDAPASSEDAEQSTREGEPQPA
jgi:F-type H+-transporting ATPase subunit alpha